MWLIVMRSEQSNSFGVRDMFRLSWNRSVASSWKHCRHRVRLTVGEPDERGRGGMVFDHILVVRERIHRRDPHVLPLEHRAVSTFCPRPGTGRMFAVEQQFND